MSELVEVEVYSYEDPTEMLAVLDGRFLPSALEELRGNGGGDVALNIHDPKLVTQPDLLDSRNVLKFKVNGLYVGACLVGKMATRILEDDAATEIYKISGEGLRGWMNDAAVHPEGGLRKSSFTERAFNFATARGDWYDESQWVVPYNVVTWGDVVGSPWRYAPAEWPDVPLAKWIWSSNSISGAAEGDNFFRYEFNASIDAKYSFFLAADDQYSMYIDGQLVEASEPDAVAWTQVNRTDIDLLAGDHVFAVRVFNKASTPAGLLAAIFTFGDPDVPSSASLVDYTGNTLVEATARLSIATTQQTAAYNKWNALAPGPAKDKALLAYQAAQRNVLAATNAKEKLEEGEGWLVAGYPDPLPGWSAGEIVLTLLAEAEARGVLFPLWLTPTFTSTHDTYGNEWPRDLDWSFDVGESLSNVVERLEELVCDLWVDPETLELNMAIERGVDRSVYEVEAGPTYRNRIGNPDTVSGGSAFTVSGGVGSYTGGKHRHTATGGVASLIYPAPPASEALVSRFTVTSGHNYAWRVKITNPNAFTVYYRGAIGWYIASGAAAVPGVTNSSITALAAGATVTLEMTGVVPTATSGGDIASMLPIVYAFSTVGGTAPVAGQLTDTAEWALYTGPSVPTTSPVIFFSGATTDVTPDPYGYDYAWEGTVNASPSTAASYVPTPDGVVPLVFERGKNLLQSSIDTVGEVKNSLLLQTTDGWATAEDTASKSKYGTIEAMLDTGSSETIAQAVASAVFETKANPEVGASYEIIPFPGHVPFLDFNVGDWVLAPDILGQLVKRRVMSLSVEEDDDTGQPVYTAEFDTIFQDNEDRLSRWMEKLGGGTLGGQFANSSGGNTIPIGQPTIPVPGPAPIKIPNAVENVDATSIGLWATNGVNPFSEVHLEWDPVTGNTDNSITVPSFYEVWGRPTENSENTYQRFVTTTATEADIRPFATGTSWTFRVRAMNDANAPGEWSEEVEHTMTAPNTPMDAPDDPTLSSSKGVLIVTWNGLLDGLAPPPQFRYVFAEVSPAGDNTWTRQGSTLSRDGRNIYISGLTIGDDYDVRLTAVDGLGLETDPSGTATETVTGIDLGDLDPSVEDAIEAAAEAARLARGTTNMLTDPSFEANDPTLWSLETADVTNVTTTPRTGARVLRIDAAAAPYTASRYGLALEVDQGEQYLVSAWLRALGAGATVNEGIKLCIEYGDDNTTSDGVDEVTGSPEVDTTWIKFEDVWMVPIGARFARVRIDVADDGNTNSYLIDDMSMRMLIPNALIVDGAISADKIGAGEVIAGKLSAGAVVAGNIAAGAVVAGTIEAGTITANEIAASTITGDNIDAGTISVTNLEPSIGDDINISGNVTIVSTQEAIGSVQSDVDGVSDNLQEMQTYYTFGPDGAIISTPDSPFQLKLDNDRISMLELGNEVSYWNAGTMYVRSFVGEEVILGNHKLEKYGNGTVVRIL